LGFALLNANLLLSIFNESMQTLNRDLIRIVAGGWIAFALMGLVFSRLLAAPSVVLLIDQSYCRPADWQQVTQRYETLYQQHQRQQLKIDQVILYSDLGQEAVDSLPTPEDVRSLKTYGRPSPERQQTLLTEYPNAQVLSCQAGS
jgi:hypothetical protein